MNKMTLVRPPEFHTEIIETVEDYRTFWDKLFGMGREKIVVSVNKGITTLKPIVIGNWDSSVVPITRYGFPAKIPQLTIDGYHLIGVLPMRYNEVNNSMECEIDAYFMETTTGRTRHDKPNR